MKTLFVSDLTAGQIIKDVAFAVVEKKLSVDKTGKQFLDLTLADRTGQIRAKVWGDSMPNISLKLISVGKVLAFSGTVTEFKEQLQLNLQEIREVDETQIEEYVQASRFPADDMWQQLMQIVQTIQTEQLRQMLLTMLSDADVSRKYKYWPAGLSYHHDFRSGLLQHVLECLNFVEGIAKFYPDVDLDIVKTGIILHDIGKIDELDADSVIPRYTALGSVLGHVYIGTTYVDRFLPVDAPQILRWHLKHIILSHHGERDKGAAVLPATAEALLVHSADVASANLNMGDSGVKQPANDLGMTDYNRWLDRWMWAGSKQTEPEPSSNENSASE